MAFEITARLTNQLEFKNRVAQWSQAAKDVGRSIVNKHAQDVANRAKLNVTAVDRGRLRGDIVVQFDNDGLAAKVVARSSYAAFVEFGTGPKGRMTNKQPLPAGYTYHSGNAKMPPLELIQAWVKRKGFVAGRGKKKQDDIKQIAFLIARSIAKNGLSARPFMYQALAEVEPRYQADMQRFLDYCAAKVG